MYAFYKKHEYLFIIAFVLFSQLAVFPYLHDRYPDTDNYTHARRVLDFITTGVWAETPYMYSNYPFGEILHFTRITDIFWIIFSAPLFLFFPVKQAVFWGGFAYQGAVLVLSAVALVWALRPIAGPVLRLIVVFLLFLQPSVTETYILIKPDHHVLTAFFAFGTTGGLIHFLYDNKIKYLRIAGIFSGLTLWSSIEGLLISYPLLAGLMLLFLMKKVKARAAAVFFLYYFLSSAVFLLINPPYEGLFFPDNGRLSFLLVVVAGFTTAAMMILTVLEEKNALPGFFQKAGVLFILSAFFILLTFLIFGTQAVFSPYFPPFIKEIWADTVVELQPSLWRPVTFVLCSVPSLLAIVFGAAAFKFASAEERKTLILTGIPLIFLSILTFTALRYGRLSSLFTPFPLIIAFHTWLLKTKKYEQYADSKGKGPLVLGLFVIFTAYLGANYVSVNNTLQILRRPSLRVLAPYVDKSEGSFLADTFLGPEIIWELDGKVIGTPYHRNIQGIADNFWMLNGNNEENTIRLLKMHHVKMIIANMEIPGQPMLMYNMQQRYSFFVNGTARDKLLYKLISGRNLPCGIKEELNAPPPFLVYHVDFSGCDENQGQD